MDTLPLKPFEEMTADDYAAVGFRCGLEVHQQLLTRSKLFCRCPAGRYSADYDAEVLRHMRPTLSEMGEYDGTALMEKKTRKQITYRLHRETVCTYEFDDTPPFLIDDEAVDTALELAMLLRLNLVNELHIARKQYLDGSIPTGFQRTTILGVDGWIPFEDRRIHIRQLGLEEDSCREVSDRGHQRVYLTDRLGMPLIEVVTEPEMVTPQQAADVCDLIRKICRSTQRVRRGYGATRQDVNVSVTGGTRVEIKGVPQIWRIPRLVHNEANRQLALLLIRDELRRRGVTPETFSHETRDVTDVLVKTTYAPIRTAIDGGRQVWCVRLPGFAGLLNTPTQEYTLFAKEFSDRVRVIACLTELPNIVHSDTASESLWPQDWLKLRRRLHATDRDALICVWGEAEDMPTACEEISIRAREATEGVPSDTRQALTDGTNGFERVLPGPERMYPDTDLPPIEVTSERLRRVRSRRPEYVWDTEQRFRDGGMVAHDVQTLCISPRAPIVTRAIEELKLDAKWLGVQLAQRMRALSRLGLNPERLANDAVWELLKAHAVGRIAREGVPWLMQEILAARPEGPIIDEDLLRFLDERNVQPASDREIELTLDEALGAASPDRFATPDKRRRFVAGLLMDRLVGRVDGRKLVDRVARRVVAEPTPAMEPER